MIGPINPVAKIASVNSFDSGLLGLNHREVIYYDKGRPERVDQNEGHPYTAIV